MSTTPNPMDLWRQAGGGTEKYSPQRFHDLMVEHGHILRPGDEGYEDAPRNLPCGWPSLTPVGDYLARRYPPNPGATHYLGAGDDPGCCAGPHPACTYDAGRREGLRSLAAELDSLTHRPRLPSVSTEAHEYGSGILQGVAAMARQRAEGGPGTPMFAAPASREGQPGPAGLIAAHPSGAAIEAAAIQHVEYRGFTDPEPEDLAIAEDMLAAALPHLLAAGREHTGNEAAGAALPPCPTPCDDDCELGPDGCHESHQIPSRRVHQPEGCQEIRQAIARAVAAERARIAQLLDRKRAVFCRPCDGEVCDYSDELTPASELIRGDGDEA